MLNKMKKTLLLTSLLTTFCINAKGVSYKADLNEIPYASEVVNQLNYKSMASYPEPGTSSNWYLCGHAAFSTAINVLRSTPADDANQMDWFHNQLLSYPSYANKITNSHRESSGDHLSAIINKRDDFTAEKRSSTSRSVIIDSMQTELTNSKKQQLIALTKSNNWGHFVVVHEIYNDPNSSQLGYVRYADPYGGYASKEMGLKSFIDGMKSAGSTTRHSYWIVREK